MRLWRHSSDHDEIRSRSVPDSDFQIQIPYSNKCRYGTWSLIIIQPEDRVLQMF